MERCSQTELSKTAQQTRQREAAKSGQTAHQWAEKAFHHRFKLGWPHMSAAYGHLEQARAELDKAAPNNGGHREKAIQLVDQAMQEGKAGEAYDQERPK